MRNSGLLQKITRSHKHLSEAENRMYSKMRLRIGKRKHGKPHQKRMSEHAIRMQIQRIRLPGSNHAKRHGKKNARRLRQTYAFVRRHFQ